MLAWLGLVSYSVCLLHPLLIGIYLKLPWVSAGHPVPVQVAVAAGFFGVLLALCALTYRLVEAPMQRQGERLAAWLEQRFGPDPAPGGSAPSLWELTPGNGPPGRPGGPCHTSGLPWV